MSPVRVIVHGALGRMGREITAAVTRDPSLEAVGAIDVIQRESRLPLPNGEGTIPYANSLNELLPQCQADVVVDFSNAAACMALAPKATAAGLKMVIGTTGLKEDNLSTLASLSNRHQVGIIAVPNFAIGAVLLNYLVRIAARYFEYADIYEAHHETKIDAPSGTALGLARAIAGEKKFTRPKPETEPLPGTRGGDFNGVSIHSTRMPGRLAHHEVIFGIAGQTLSLRHDTISRECYMPALMLAIKDVVNRKELVTRLEDILGLS